MKKILTGGTVNSLYEKSLLLQLPVPGRMRKRSTTRAQSSQRTMW